MVVKVEGKLLTLEGEFNAPRELVFEAFSKAEHLKHWWGPRGWELTVCEIDFRPGGQWHYCMKCMDKDQGDFYGQESWGKSLYHEIETSEKIVYTDYFSDAEGNLSEEFPASKNVMLFQELDGKTKLINRAEYPSAEDLQKVVGMGMEQGIKETWDRLEEHLVSVKPTS